MSLFWRFVKNLFTAGTVYTEKKKNNPKVINTYSKNKQLSLTPFAKLLKKRRQVGRFVFSVHFEDNNENQWQEEGRFHLAHSDA